MKIFPVLFVLIFGFSANYLKGQSTPPTMTSVSAFTLVLGTPRVGGGSTSIFEYQFYIFTPNADVPATDVVMTVSLPVQIGYMNGSPFCTKSNPTAEQTMITCNLGTLTKNLIDYSSFVRFHLFPQMAGEAIITTTITGSNITPYTFTKKITVLPDKSRKRVRFF